jgi:hypothetical protein
MTQMLPRRSVAGNDFPSEGTLNSVRRELGAAAVGFSPSPRWRNRRASPHRRADRGLVSAGFASKPARRTLGNTSADHLQCIDTEAPPPDFDTYTGLPTLKHQLLWPAVPVPYLHAEPALAGQWRARLPASQGRADRHAEEGPGMAGAGGTTPMMTQLKQIFDALLRAFTPDPHKEDKPRPWPMIYPACRWLTTHPVKVEGLWWLGCSVCDHTELWPPLPPWRRRRRPPKRELRADDFGI